MKNLIVIVFVLFSSYLKSQTTEKEIVPNLASVKVFTAAAQLCYHSPIELPKGTTTLKLKNLSTKIDLQSLLINFSDSAVKIASVVYKVNTKEEVKNGSHFLDSLSQIEHQIESTKNLISTYQNQQKLLYNLVNNSKTATTPEFEKSLVYFGEKNTAICEKIQDLEVLLAKYVGIEKNTVKK